MNMLWHYHESLHATKLQELFGVKEDVDDHIGNQGLSQIYGAAAGLIQESVGGCKCFSRRQRCGWKAATGG
jgi:hypothetical protein